MQMGNEGMGQQGTNGQGGGRRQRMPARTTQNNLPPAQVAPKSDDGVIHEAAGTWKYSIDSPQGGGGTIVLTRSGDVYSGVIRRDRAPQDVTLENVAVKGNEISFSFPTSFGGNTMVITVNAVISEADMSGTMQIGEMRTFNLIAKRAE